MSKTVELNTPTTVLMGVVLEITWEEFFKSHAPKLDSDNFIEQVVTYGYFAEVFPACFTSQLLALKLDEILPLAHCTKRQVDNAKKNATLPVTLSMKKDDVTRRILSLPNPEAFLRLVKSMKENWNEVQEFAESENSLSPITYIHEYGAFGERAMLNNENLRESMHVRSDYIDGIRNCIQAALGYKFRLKVDIANCYTSIYTHSIAWAICGKAAAKRYLRTKEPVALKKKYELADKLDAFIRFQKNNETNGIVVGPFSSRIFSEIILAAIDKELVAQRYIFRRYVDDYKFYFRSEAQAKESIPQIERIISEYGLHLNAAKTEITPFPFEMISQMKDVYEGAKKDKGVFGVLNAASQLYSSGEKGAYKYALKYISNMEPKIEDFGVIMSSLISILFVEPKYGKYVTEYLRKHIHKWKQDVVIELINKELSISIHDELQQETLVFLNIIKELKLSIWAKNLIDVLRCSNDFAIVIALDIWKSRKKSVQRTRSQATEINKSIEWLSSELSGEEYSGSRWFLLHEIKMHGLMTAKLMPKPGKTDFFNELQEQKVTFYRSIGRKLY